MTLAECVDMCRGNIWRDVLGEQKLTRTEGRVAALLEFMARESSDGTVQVSVDDIADYFKRTPKTISGCLHRLIERGAIRLVEPAKSHQPARYAVDYDWANTPMLALAQRMDRKMAEYEQMMEMVA